MSDLWVMLHPDAVYPQLVKAPADTTRWTAVRRPLLMAVILGCTISLMTEGSVTARLALPAAIYWSFMPLLQVACVAISHRLIRPETSLPRAIDLSFAADGPWLLWLLAYASIWALLPPERAYFQANIHWFWYGLAMVAAIWSGYIDFWYFRAIFGQSPMRAGRSILFYRAVCWPIFLVVFAWSAGWQTVAGWLGL
jgi:hypothetical protein